jgi:hypothetical protein
VLLEFHFALLCIFYTRFVLLLGAGFSSTKNIEKERKKTVVGLERGPLSLVSTTEELLDRKIAAPV